MLDLPNATINNVNFNFTVPEQLLRFVVGQAVEQALAPIRQDIAEGFTALAGLQRELMSEQEAKLNEVIATVQTEAQNAATRVTDAVTSLESKIAELQAGQIDVTDEIGALTGVADTLRTIGQPKTPPVEPVE